MSASRPRPGEKARKPFYVDLQMCGGEQFLEDFDLLEFCSILQGLVPFVQIIPLPEPSRQAHNTDSTLVSDSLFNEAVRQYCQR